MNAVVPITQKAGEIMEAVIARGDLAQLTPAERAKYYTRVCESIGLNPMTKPFEYITLNGKLTLYARRDAADQLRKINGISIEVVSRTIDEGLLTVHVRAIDKAGRKDEDFGVVAFNGLKGEAAANAMLKAITKAKRRVTLSLSGLGWLDETEVEDIPTVKGPPPTNGNGTPTPPDPDAEPKSGEILPPDPDETRAGSEAGAVAGAGTSRSTASAGSPEPHKSPQANHGTPPVAQPARAPDLRPADDGMDPPSFLERRPQKTAEDRKADEVRRREAAEQLEMDVRAAGHLISDTWPARPKALCAALWRKCADARDLTDLVEVDQWAKQQFGGLAATYTLAATAILESHRKRLAPADEPEGLDAAQWEKDLDGALGAAEDSASLSEVKNKTLLPAQGKVPDEVYARGKEKYLARVNEMTSSLLDAG